MEKINISNKNNADRVIDSLCASHTKTFSIVSQTKGLLHGTTVYIRIFQIKDGPTCDKFFKELNLASLKNPSFPMMCVVTDEYVGYELTFFYSADSFNELIKLHKAELKEKFEKRLIVEILADDRDAFCVDLNQIVYISKVREHEKYNPANFSIAHRNSDPLRVEFQSTAKAREAHKELSELFKRV